MITTKLMLRYRSHFPKLLSSPSIFSRLRTTTTSAASSTAVISSHSLFSFSYGSSLQKSTFLSKPQIRNHSSNVALNPVQQTQIPKNADDPPFDEDEFTRVFGIAALRVPSERCFALKGRLRGHLLNWPRISNIARVPVDEIEGDVQELFEKKGLLGEDEVEKAVSRRISGKAEGDGEKLSGVLYNDRRFVKFRNLAKISRPNTRKKRRKEGQGEEERGKMSVLVEVVEERKCW